MSLSQQDKKAVWHAGHHWPRLYRADLRVAKRLFRNVVIIFAEEEAWEAAARPNRTSLEVVGENLCSIVHRTCHNYLFQVSAGKVETIWTA